MNSRNAKLKIEIDFAAWIKLSNKKLKSWSKENRRNLPDLAEEKMLPMIPLELDFDWNLSINYTTNQAGILTGWSTTED